MFKHFWREIVREEHIEENKSNCDEFAVIEEQEKILQY